ncbi:MAG TPA: hypothetical protein VJT78_07265 [Candidatus Dormibacteraeota bacterium]|nr:hypothetical protein [Candidatus Dormibacteraeota bacterium]
MTPEERELRRALDARSAPPSPEFAARLGASLDQARRARPNVMPAVALVAAIALTAGTVGVLVMARNLNRVSHGPGQASSTRLPSPTATPVETPPASNPSSPPISLPTTLQLSAAPGNVVWALIDARIFRSVDAGSTWQERRAPPYQGGGGMPEISFVDQRNGWMLFPGVPETQCNGAGAQVWRTTDGALTWTLVAQVTGPNQAPALGYTQCKDHVDFVDATHGLVTASDPNRRPTIWRTADGGVTWLSSILPDPPGFVGQAGGFELRVDAIQGFGATIVLTASGRQDGDTLDRFYFFQSTDGGRRWVYSGRLPDTASRAVALVTASRFLSIFPGSPSLESDDAGRTWHSFTSDYQQAAGVAPQIVFGDPVTGYATVRGGIQRTTDGGARWASVSTPGVAAPG